MCDTIIHPTPTRKAIMANRTGQTAAQIAAQQATNMKNMLSSGGKTYDPDMLYTAATNDRFYEQVRMKIPPDLLNVINYIVGGSDGFNHYHDFFRDSVHHRAHYFLDKDPDTPQRILDLMEMEDWNIELLTQQREELAEKEQFELIRERMNSMIDDLDWKGLQNLWERADEMADRTDLPEGRRKRFEVQADELFDAMHNMKKQKSRYQQMVNDTNVTPIRKKAQ